MLSRALAAGCFVLGMSQTALAQSRICTGSSCDNCPVTTSDSGSGFPECSVYRSKDVFGGSFKPDPTTGQWDVWFDIPQAGPTCNYVIKSPASVMEQKCGKTTWSGQGGYCRNVRLAETFMLQWCCGNGDCCEAGVANIPGCNNDKKRDSSPSRRRELLSRPVFTMRSPDGDEQVNAMTTGGGALVLKGADGKVIEPASKGTPPAPGSGSSSSSSRRSNDDNDEIEAAELGLVQARGVRCTKDSWVDDGSEFTTTADNTQMVTTRAYPAGTEVTITKTRTQGWSTSMEASFGFADIFSMGVSFSVTESEEISDSEAATFTMPEGPSAYVGFTAFLLCKKGSGECDGGTVSGLVCTPYKSNGVLAGEYGIVQSG